MLSARLSLGVIRCASQSSNMARTAQSLFDETRRLHQDIKRAIIASDISAVETELGKATFLASNNVLKPRDFATILNSVSKMKLQDDGLTHIHSLIKHFITRTRKSPAFIAGLTPIDIVQSINGLSKLSRGADQPDANLEKMLETLVNLVPSKISLFEDHHLALILSATKRRQTDFSPVLSEVLAEISQRRDLSSFNLQSIVMIASALSSFSALNPRTLENLWESIISRVSKFQKSDFQPSWSSVIVSSVAKSKHRPKKVSEEFLNLMKDKLREENETGIIDVRSLAKSKAALENMEQCHISKCRS